METKTVNKMMEENGQEMRWGWWDGETTPLSLFQHFPELFRKEGNGKEKKCCGDHSFGEAMNASRIGESAPQPGSSFLWEALGLQGVNSVARELGLSVWLVMDGETR